MSRIIRVRVVSQESEDAVKALAKEKDLLEREKWDLRRQTKEATEHTGMLRSQLDLKENRIKELEAELAMVRSPRGQEPPQTDRLWHFRRKTGRKKINYVIKCRSISLKKKVFSKDITCLLLLREQAEHFQS